MSNPRDRTGRVTPKPVRPIKTETVKVSELKPKPESTYAVTQKDREGVWAHSFKCLSCQLEFVTFSWQPNRHRVGTIVCPESASEAPMLHCRAILSESAEFDLFGPKEIFRLWPWPGSEFMDDSVAS